jgi:tRNA pseudouridine55 synthase
VGHLGTLDPIATGVLPLLVGRATRLAQFYGARRKRYEGSIRFGFATNTYDADGTPLGEDRRPALSREQRPELIRLPMFYTASPCARAFAQSPLARRQSRCTEKPARCMRQRAVKQ